MEYLPSDTEAAWLVEQTARLIRECGPEPFVSSVILEPSRSCFPDRWTPDTEGVRTLVLRLLSYAQLTHLDARVELFSSPAWQAPALGGLPGVRTMHKQGAAALFAGILDDVCYFGVDEAQLEEPGALVGVLSHEVTHAWRAARGVVEQDRKLEELLTDMTTVYLGFGVLTANAAYRYEAQGDIRRMEWRHSRAGYLPPEAMCYLLAVQSVVRGGKERTVRKHLQANQAAFYQAAFRTIDREAMLASLALPAEDEWPPLRDPEPAILKPRLSPGQQRLRDCAERLVAEAGDQPAVFATPVVCDFDGSDFPHEALGMWGAVSRRAPGASGLMLTEVPDMPILLLLRSLRGPSGQETVAYGFVHDEIADHRKRLLPVLSRWFAANGNAAHPLAGQLPTFVRWFPGTQVRFVDLHDLWFLTAAGLHAAELAPWVERQERFARDPWARMRAESGAGGPALACPEGEGAVAEARLSQEQRALLERWWDVVTEPKHIEFELVALNELLEGATGK